METYRTELNAGQNEGEWSLTVKTPDGLSLEYRCKSLQRAKFMAAIFELGPTTLPPADRIHFPSREKTRVRRKRVRLANVTADELDTALEALAG